ncbi:hypothetical protein Tco_0899184 [Tanacetum coccineum]
MTLPQPETTNETTTEAINPARLLKKSEAHRWTFIIPRISTWRDQEGAHSTYKIGESSSAAHDHIEEIHNHLREIPLDRVETVEHELETLCDRVEAAKHQIKVLHDSLGIDQERIIESQIRMEDVEARLQQSELREMELRACLRRLEYRLGIDLTRMKFTAIEQLIAQLVADAITAYEVNRASGNRAHNETSGTAGGVQHVVRSCSYKEFLVCKPLNFKGTEGAVEGALTWWNSYVNTIGLEATYETMWKELKEMMIDEYCPRNEF